LDLDMSVLPISEALQRLESDGTGRKSAPRRHSGPNPSASEVRDFYVIREALECKSARLFTERAKPAGRMEVARMAEHVGLPRSGSKPAPPAADTHANRPAASNLITP
jgi:DNA-binding GntR family transcriptional regulator